MTDTSLNDEQRQRATAATIAGEVLRARGVLSVTLPLPARQVLPLAEWIFAGAPELPSPPMMFGLFTGESDEPVAEYPQEDAEEPMVSNRMVLEFTYDSPITHDTVNALADAHQADEGILRVRGRLVP